MAKMFGDIPFATGKILDDYAHIFGLNRIEHKILFIRFNESDRKLRKRLTYKIKTYPNPANNINNGRYRNEKV